MIPPVAEVLAENGNFFGVEDIQRDILADFESSGDDIGEKKVSTCLENYVINPQINLLIGQPTVVEKGWICVVDTSLFINKVNFKVAYVSQGCLHRGVGRGG